MLNTTDKIIKHKVGLLNLADELGNVSKACQVMGMSRDTFYAINQPSMMAALKLFLNAPGASPIWPTGSVIKSATDFPAYGQARTSNELRSWGSSSRPPACDPSGCGIKTRLWHSYRIAINTPPKRQPSQSMMASTKQSCRSFIRR